MKAFTIHHDHSHSLGHLASTCSHRFREVWDRRLLTPQERANLMASHSPVAIYTASLGGHPHHFDN